MQVYQTGRERNTKAYKHKVNLGLPLKTLDLIGDCWIFPGKKEVVVGDGFEPSKA
jgi:hypothetical protein